ncbi:telethonin [Paroedura picta]|uniref:telethonin n=1 Tax=Paroedura picta TaxID=143630 RepID=UPI004056FBB3
MHGKSVVLRSSGNLTAAELGCQVSERDTGRKESFSAEWKDLSLSTRPEEGCLWSEVDRGRRESCRQQQEVRMVVQRSPWGMVRLGLLGQPLTSYHLPYARALPLPIFSPAKLSGKEEEVAPAAEPLLLPPSGLCPDKTPLVEITKELPPIIEPSRPTFRKAGPARSLSRSTSQEAQRG